MFFNNRPILFNMKSGDFMNKNFPGLKFRKNEPLSAFLSNPLSFNRLVNPSPLISHPSSLKHICFACEGLTFGLQKTVFWNLKPCLLQPETYIFRKKMLIPHPSSLTPFSETYMFHSRRIEKNPDRIC